MSKSCGHQDLPQQTHSSKSNHPGLTKMCGWTLTAGTMLQRRLHKSILTRQGCCITSCGCQCVSKQKALCTQGLPNLVLHIHIMPRPEESEWEDVPGGDAAPETPPHMTGIWLPGGVPDSSGIVRTNHLARTVSY